MERKFVFGRQLQHLITSQRISDAQVRQMEVEIMLGYGDVVPNTAGLRKIRCGGQGRGKRGGIRVLFADYPNAGVTYLLAGMVKNQQGDFPRDELRVLKELKRHLDKLHKDKNDGE
jgi:hypothetical protein